MDRSSVVIVCGVQQPHRTASNLQQHREHSLTPAREVMQLQLSPLSSSQIGSTITPSHYKSLLNFKRKFKTISAEILGIRPRSSREVSGTNFLPDYNSRYRDFCSHGLGTRSGGKQNGIWSCEGQVSWRAGQACLYHRCEYMTAFQFRDLLTRLAIPPEVEFATDWAKKHQAIPTVVDAR